MTDYSFPSSRRLHDGRDYGRVFWRQQKMAGSMVVLLAAPRNRTHLPSRLGIMVSTKVARDAVRRHQLKRWVREWFRTQEQARACGCDLVVLFRRDPPAEAHRNLVDELDRLLPKALSATPQPGSGPGRRSGKGRR